MATVNTYIIRYQYREATTMEIEYRGSNESAAREWFEETYNQSGNCLIISIRRK